MMPYLCTPARSATSIAVVAWCKCMPAFLDAWRVHQEDCSFPLARSTYCLSRKKKKKHARKMQPLRRLTVGNGRTRYYFPAELYLLFMMDWSLQWGFLVGFCVAQCFFVWHNLFLQACTAILRIVHNSDSGRASACTYFVIFYRFRRFSTLAEEGFTCLDHSLLSEKKV